MITSLLAWLGRALSDGGSGLPSVKRLSFFLTVSVLVGGVTAALVGALVTISIGVQPDRLLDMARVLSDLIQTMVLTAVSAVTGGYLGGKAIERKPGTSTTTTEKPKADQ
ncbi:hypothetical protein [Pseudomonas sp.]|jgi:hypothetical protein|uniref:hypothetical protein n=1 Tax=Pseudomonas sp. TaxID=306 RepID=UPI002EDB6471